jgi:hypothetical protein
VLAGSFWAGEGIWGANLESCYGICDLTVVLLDGGNSVASLVQLLKEIVCRLHSDESSDVFQNTTQNG